MQAKNRRMTQASKAWALIYATLLILGSPDAVEVAAETAAENSRVTCPFDRGPVTTNILYRIFPLRVKDRVGTGFTLEIDNKQYIVTAKHILAEEAPDTIEIQTDEWITIPVKLVGKGQGRHDVVVFAANQRVSSDFQVDVGMGGLMLGQAVRFLGFFPGVKTSPLPGYKHRGSPLVMGGIVSGIDFTNGSGPSLWIDGHNNKGFSGGPVIFQPAQARSREGCRWRIAGVISGYVNAPIDVVVPPGQQPVASAISNAGLLRAIPIRTVRELVNANPIGYSVQ